MKKLFLATFVLALAACSSDKEEEKTPQPPLVYTEVFQEEDLVQYVSPGDTITIRSINPYYVSRLILTDTTESYWEENTLRGLKMLGHDENNLYVIRDKEGEPIWDFYTFEQYCGTSKTFPQQDIQLGWLRVINTDGENLTAIVTETSDARSNSAILYASTTENNHYLDSDPWNQLWSNHIIYFMLRNE